MIGSSTDQKTAAAALDLLLQLRRPTEVAISPDGERVAFTVSPAAIEDGRGFGTRLWLDELGADPLPLSDGSATEGVPRFSPDGERLAFASDAAHPGRMSLRLRDRGELGSIAGSVEDIRWAPDSRSLLVLAADLGSDRAGVHSATTIQRTGTRDDPRVHRPARYWRRLFLVDVDTGDTREVSPQGLNVFEFDWAGGPAVAVCTDDPSEGAWYDAWIGLIEVPARTAERVHTADWQLQCPRISPGGRVAWIEGFASDRATVTGTVHVLGVGALAPDLDATWISFADEETLWYAGRRRSGSAFGKLRLDGSQTELFGGDLLLGAREQPRVSPSATGTRVAAVLETTKQPPEVVLLENGSTRPITSLNEDLGPQLMSADWQKLTWESFDGLEVEGLLALPRERESTPLPLVVCVHGGPTSTWTWGVFSYRPYLHPLSFAQEGYAVLLPNPRGSNGRGQEFARANHGDLGGGDLQDIVAGIEALVDSGTVDSERVAITGSSYGGFMSAWAVTQTDRFAAAIPCSVVTDWVSFHLTTNIGQFDRLYLDDDPYDPGGSYVRQSPVYHAKSCTTPTLILQGEADLCTPLPQALEFYNALVEAGCQAELVVYPREGHFLLEREHQIDAWARIREWLKLHLR